MLRTNSCRLPKKSIELIYSNPMKKKKLNSTAIIKAIIWFSDKEEANTPIET
jgi:spore coat polysaccharide biosynthesis protein SpsF (cytidylyltransferase family)